MKTKEMSWEDQVENAGPEHMTEKQAKMVARYKAYIEQRCYLAGGLHYEVKEWEVRRTGRIVYVRAVLGLPNDEGKMTQVFCRYRFYIGFLPGGGCLTIGRRTKSFGYTAPLHAFGLSEEM